MSLDIDIEKFSGVTDQAAVDHPVESNSYAQEANDVSFVDESLLEKPLESQSDSELKPKEVSPQELNFEALRSEVDRIKQERERERTEFQTQLELMRANLQKPQEAPKQSRMFEGMSDNDVPNVAEIRQAWEQRESEYQARIEELQVAQAHPDYQEVMEKFTLPLVKNKPHFIKAIQGADNKALTAYELGKMAQQMQAQTAAPQATVQSPVAQKIVENARKPGNLAAAGGQGTLSKADYFASMSDADFMKIAMKNLEGI